MSNYLNSSCLTIKRHYIFSKTGNKVLETSTNAVNFVIAKDQFFSIIIFKEKERRVLITQ